MALSIFSALYLAFGTGLAYVAVFFGTPFFAFFAALTWAVGLALAVGENPPLWQCLLFTISGLLTGLVRPEGAILAVLMLTAVVFMKGWRASGRILAVFVPVFLILGGAYFLWRWNYFGHPLPNPFYKKSGGFSHLGSLEGSWLNVLRLCAPFWIAFVIGLRSSIPARRTAAFLIPIVIFTTLFALISDETNYGARFQYALVPVVLMSWYPLVEGRLPSWRPRLLGRERAAWTAAALFAAGGLLLYSGLQNCFLTSAQTACASPNPSDGRYQVAAMLSEFQGRGYVIATSEAGLLPYYSDWTAVDTWGLNDAWIARNGSVTEEYLDRYRPHVIVFHAYFSPLVPPKLTEENLAQDWYRMTVTLMDYAERRGYILAAAFGDSPYEAHYYYVRPDFADSSRIVRRIASMKDYHWPASGKKSINYAQLSQP